GGSDPGPRLASAMPRPTPSASVTGVWARRLARLDDARSAAWSSARPALLRDVFRAGSAVLRSDRRLLASYDRRGLTLTGLQVSYFDVRPVARAPGRVDLRTVDQLRVGSVTSADGTPVELPHDQPTAHLIRLVRTTAGWRISRIEVR